MLTCYVQATTKETLVPVHAVITQEFEGWFSKQKERLKNWVKTTKFKAESGSSCVILNAAGEVEQILLGVKNAEDFWAYGALPRLLPEGAYQITAKLSKENFERAALAWALGTYQFSRYKKPLPLAAKLYLPKQSNLALLQQWAQTIFLVRDLINTPTDDLGPAEIAEAVVEVAGEYKAVVSQIIGDELLEEGYTAIYAVGRASIHAPRLIDLRWGDPKHPKVTLVGKGVCFDSGGLDLKSADGMSQMKKDMGGAAHALGLARMIMQQKLPVCLRLLIPTVENALSGNAYHPGDILVTRKGISVEVTNTDAEGRLILCDVLAEAASDKPKILIDFATLTGAASVALGPEIPSMYTLHDGVANGLLEWSQVEQEAMWRMPLHMPYRAYLDSQIADMVNACSTRYAGSITAALFLKAFVPDEIPWVHFDLMAANTKARPGRPEGGEAMILRTVFSFLRAKFNK